MPVAQKLCSCEHGVVTVFGDSWFSRKMKCDVNTQLPQFSIPRWPGIWLTLFEKAIISILASSFYSHLLVFRDLPVGHPVVPNWGHFLSSLRCMSEQYSSSPGTFFHNLTYSHLILALFPTVMTLSPTNSLCGLLWKRLMPRRPVMAASLGRPRRGDESLLGYPDSCVRAFLTVD